MSIGEDAADRLAHALSESEFDAVERDGLRAAWTDDGSAVVVEPIDDPGDRSSGTAPEKTDGEADAGTDAGRERVVYNGEDLVRATSDRELGDAREPEPEPRA